MYLHANVFTAPEASPGTLLTLFHKNLENVAPALRQLPCRFLIHTGSVYSNAISFAAPKDSPRTCLSLPLENLGNWAPDLRNYRVTSFPHKKYAHQCNCFRCLKSKSVYALSHSPESILVAWLPDLHIYIYIMLGNTSATGLIVSRADVCICTDTICWKTLPPRASSFPETLFYVYIYIYDMQENTSTVPIYAYI